MRTPEERAEILERKAAMEHRAEVITKMRQKAEAQRDFHRWFNSNKNK